MKGPKSSLKSPLNGLAKVRQSINFAKLAHKKRLNFELWKTNQQEEEEEAEAENHIKQSAKCLEAWDYISPGSHEF